MTAMRGVLAAIGGLVLAGCAIVPTEPVVPAFPGTQATGSGFQTDDGACRARALEALGPEPATSGATSAQLQRRYDGVYFDCMYARGHRVPAGAVAHRTPRTYEVPQGAAPAAGYPPRDARPPAGYAPPATAAPPQGFPPADAPPPKR
jgi:hypothetical protein